MPALLDALSARGATLSLLTHAQRDARRRVRVADRKAVAGCDRVEFAIGLTPCHDVDVSHPLVELTTSRVPRVPARAGGGLLGLCVSDHHDLRAGIAFRSSGGEPVIVGVVQQAGSAEVTKALEAAGGFTVRRDRARRTSSRAVRDGRAPVVVGRARRRSITSTKRAPRARRRGWRSMRRCSRPPAGSDAFTAGAAAGGAIGSRYIDWLVPGLLGMNIMSTGLWGVGFAIVNARTRKLLKRLVATPMSTRALPRVARPQPPGVSRARVHGARGLRLARVRRRRARVDRGAGRHRRHRRAVVRRPGAAREQPRADDRSGLGSAEPGDAADVGAVGRVLRVEQLSRRRCSRSFRRCRSPRSSTRCAA